MKNGLYRGTLEFIFVSRGQRDINPVLKCAASSVGENSAEKSVRDSQASLSSQPRISLSNDIDSLPSLKSCKS